MCKMAGQLCTPQTQSNSVCTSIWSPLRGHISHMRRCFSYVFAFNSMVAAQSPQIGDMLRAVSGQSLCTNPQTQIQTWWNLHHTKPSGSSAARRPEVQYLLLFYLDIVLFDHFRVGVERRNGYSNQLLFQHMAGKYPNIVLKLILSLSLSLTS